MTTERNVFQEWIEQRGILVFDSAMGAALLAEKASAQIERSEAANLSNPETVERIHRENIDAGCDVILTNTFGVAAALAKDPSAVREAETMVKAGLSIARRAADGAKDRQVLVALDIGPVGEIIGFTGDLDHDGAKEIFATIVRSGATGADLIAIETVADIEELKDAIIAAKQESDLPILASMTYDAGGRTFMGVTPEEHIAVAQELGAQAIGVNCTLDSATIAGPVRALLAGSGLPVCAQPNAGQPVVKDGNTVYLLTPDAFEEDMEKLIDMGVSMAGGCCGTTPEMVSRLRKIANLKGAFNGKTKLG